MNNNSCKKFLNKILVLTKKLDYIKQMENKINNDLDHMKKLCKHDLVLIYNERKISYLTYKEAKCLMCDKSFYIENNKILELNMNNIIDLTNHIPNCTWNSYINGKSELVIEAQRILNLILTYNDYIELEEIKEMITRHLIEFYFERTKEVKKLLKKGDKNE